MKTIMSLLIFLTINFICQSQDESLSLLSDKILVQLYSNSEIDEIDKILEYSDQKVKEYTGKIDIMEAYHFYWNMLNESFKKGDYYPLVNDIDKYEFFTTIDRDVFNSIWKYKDNLGRVTYRDSTLTDVNVRWMRINIKGGFSQYLRRKGEGNPIFGDLHKRFIECGGIPSTTFPAFARRHQEYALSPNEFRILSAYLLLSMENTFEEKIDRDNKNKL